jgi:hypothetical protein
MDFFAISPVNLDPYGLMRKLDLIMRQADDRFRWFVKQIGPGLKPVESANVKNALAAAMTAHQIAKLVRHVLEIIKKYKIFQLALLLQMQLPLIKRLAVAASKATSAFTTGAPIGDSIGPLTAASMMNGKTKLYPEEEFAVCRARIAGRSVLIAKAAGPGAATGWPGKFLLKLLKRQKIDRIITVDAGMRLEGEKIGTVAEGVGVALGGTGVDRYEIEEVAVKRKLPLDAIVIKVNEVEALTPMAKEVLAAVPKAVAAVEAAINRAKKGERILVMGVGNTVGIGNSRAAASEAVQRIKSAIRRAEAEKKKKR